MKRDSAGGSAPAPSVPASRSAKKPEERLEVGVPVELEMQVGFRNLQPLRKGKRGELSPTARGLEKRKGGGETAGCDGGRGCPAQGGQQD